MQRELKKHVPSDFFSRGIVSFQVPNVIFILCVCSE